MLLVENVLFYYFFSAVLYTLVLSFAGKLYKPKRFKNIDARNNSIVILVPCYKEDEVILSTSKKLLELKYPKESFDVVVIADSLQEKTLKDLSELELILVLVKFDKSTKTKALNAAFEKLQRKYEIGIIMDADNVANPDFLIKINDAYNAGNLVIQAQRVAKNLNTPFSILDASSEIINNHLFRKGANALGLSSSIIGSGMAYPYSLLKEELSSISAVGGFDKVLQLRVMEKGIKILYLEGALIFDEKIESAEAFKTQRQRWLSSQLIYAKLYFFKGFKLLFKGNLNYFHQAVLYNLFPPRILMIFCLLTSSLLSTFIFYPNFSIISKWYLLFIVYSFALAIALPYKFYNREFLKAVQQIPLAMLKMIQALFNTKGADKKFIHTRHTRVDIDNSLYNNND